LRLLERDHDPAKSREHARLSVLAERRLVAGQTADLDALLEEREEPPLDRIGVLDLDDFMSKRDRRERAAALNTLIRGPTTGSEIRKARGSGTRAVDERSVRTRGFEPARAGLGAYTCCVIGTERRL
jgi:hypothetical protein